MTNKLKICYNMRWARAITEINKGPGQRSIFTVWLFQIEEHVSYHEFFQYDKILSIAKVIADLYLKNTINKSHKKKWLTGSQNTKDAAECR